MRTTRLHFRKFASGDFDFYYQLAGNYEVMKLITGETLSLDEAQKKYSKILEINDLDLKTGYYFISTLNKMEFVGLGKIVFTKISEVEIGYMLLPSFWGKGFGKEISDKLVNIAKGIDSVKTLMAVIDPDNLASKKILLRSSFVLNEVCSYKGLPAEIYRLRL